MSRSSTALATRLIVPALRRSVDLLLIGRDRRAPLMSARPFAIEVESGVIQARLYTPETAPTPSPLLVYFPGGGFICGGVDTHDGLCRRLAAASGVRLLSVGYRLAPESPFPTQVGDAYAAIGWARAHADQLGVRTDRMALGGDSAGGYLAATCALGLGQSEPGSVTLQLLIYPLLHLDETLWRSALLANFRLAGRLATLSIRHEIGPAPFPSVLEMDLAAAPDTLLVSGPLDPVSPDVRRLAGRLRAAGRRVIERNDLALGHGSFNLGHVSKRAARAIDEVGVSLGGALSSGTE